MCNESRPTRRRDSISDLDGLSAEQETLRGSRGLNRGHRLERKIHLPYESDRCTASTPASRRVPTDGSSLEVGPRGVGRVVAATPQGLAVAPDLGIDWLRQVDKLLHAVLLKRCSAARTAALCSETDDNEEALDKLMRCPCRMGSSGRAIGLQFNDLSIPLQMTSQVSHGNAGRA